MNPDKQNIKFLKMDGRLKIRTTYKSAFQRWKYICIVYNYGKEIDIYIYGEVIGSTTLNPLPGGGILILGQEQLFDSSQSFSGTLTQVNIWSTLLDNTTIKMYSNCLLSGPDNQMGDVVSWLEEDREFINARVETPPKT